jgi:excisionase family DNA binding protein
MNKISLTMKVASETSGLSVRKLYDLIGEKKLQSVKVGRRRLVIARSLEELLLGKAQKQTRGGATNGE